MIKDPVVSFIVPLYNYEQYVGLAIQSILDQSIQQLEIIVIDDASTDGSREVIRRFSDPRIRLYINERNMGQGWTSERGITHARGEFVVYLDADDWIDQRKTELQLDFFRNNPDVDIVSTYATAVDADGNRHPSAAEFEGWTNRPLDFNVIDTWIVRCLVTGSVMIRRAAHQRVGLRDETMILADYEFWTRALRYGCRFGLIPAPLLMRRRHEKNLSYADPMRAFVELTYAMRKNLMPIVQTRARLHLVGAIIGWVTTHQQFLLMSEPEQYRMLGLLLSQIERMPFSAFNRAIFSQDDTELLGLGKHFYEAIA
jgi:glycosyltransferase involved in cell wall biosynthesis